MKRMKNKLLDVYTRVAREFASLSYARRLRVGSIIVKDDRIISIGYNGTPAGWDNNCEFEWRDPQSRNVELRTKPEVIHAEMNALGKLAKSDESGEGATMFVTHAPCTECAKLIATAGIKTVYYREAYRDDYGVQFLLKAGVEVVLHKESDNVA